MPDKPDTHYKSQVRSAGNAKSQKKKKASVAEIAKVQRLLLHIYIRMPTNITAQHYWMAFEFVVSKAGAVARNMQSSAGHC